MAIKAFKRYVIVNSNSGIIPQFRTSGNYVRRLSYYWDTFSHLKAKALQINADHDHIKFFAFPCVLSVKSCSAFGDKCVAKNLRT